MFSVPQYNSSELQQHNYFVMQEPVFEEKIEEPVFMHVYEENGVLYCASSTSQGVYWYTYALNNPLTFSDPSGYYVNPIVASDQGVLNWLGGSIHSSTSRVRIPTAGPSFGDLYTQVGSINGEPVYAKNGVDLITFSSSTPGFETFVTDLMDTYNDVSFNLSVESQYGALWVVGNSTVTNQQSSFSGINSSNYLHYGVATVFSQYLGNGWDLNADGKLQKNEADNWWINGKGVGIRVDNSKIDWSGLKIPKGISIGDRFSIKTTTAFLRLPYETAATYGGTTFEVVGPSWLEVQDQLYHYNMKPSNSFENRVRNFMTRFGMPSGQGIDYTIYYYNPIFRVK